MKCLNLELYETATSYSSLLHGNNFDTREQQHQLESFNEKQGRCTFIGIDNPKDQT